MPFPVWMATARAERPHLELDQMTDSGLALPVGRSVPLPGHFDTPVVLEEARRLGSGYECRVRLPSGGIEEVVISAEEAAALAALAGAAQRPKTVDPKDLQLLVESARIRLAYAHDRQFAVSLSGRGRTTEC